MSNAITISRVNVAPLEFTPEQHKMILTSFLSGASPQEAAVLLELARIRRLNPITRQIHFVKRFDLQRGAEVWSAQVGIDGFRAIAERTGLYDGQDEPEFEYDGKQLKLCRVRIYRKDWTRPVVGVAHFGEYAQRKKDGSLVKMWAEKPHVMIAKCAEALAFRKAFPEDTSGLYAPEEIPAEERDVTPATPPPSTGKRTAELRAQLAAKQVTLIDVQPGETEEQATKRTETPAAPALKPWEKIKAALLAHGVEESRHAAIVKGATGKEKRGQLTEEDVGRVVDALGALGLAPEPPADVPLPTEADVPF